MEELSKERLSRIADEVAELHPLLQRLLPKLDGVAEVEYTHGTAEKGADFIVHQRDTALGDIDYVGVVAKVGRVLQDFTDIERQIDECLTLERPVQRGKRKQRLDAVWVVATAHISVGAKDKIQAKFASAKVKFIDGQKLAALIDERIPDFWTDINLEIGEYLSRLRGRIDSEDRSLSLLPADSPDLYVDQDLYRGEEDDYKSKGTKAGPRERVDIFQEIVKQDALLIEGGMGAGKSKLLRRMAMHFATPEVFLEHKLFPIVVKYPEFVEKDQGNLKSLIDRVIAEAGCKDQVDEIAFLVLVDGLDERKQDLEEQLGALRVLVEEARQLTNVKVVVTSRYLRALNRPGGVKHGAARYELTPLTLKRVGEFLGAVCDKANLNPRTLEDLKKSQLFKELPRSPIAAIILAQLLNDNAKDVPSNMTELYSKYTELMLGKWDFEKGLQGQKEFEALSHILATLARYFMENELYAMSEVEARGMFRDYLKERNLGINADELFDGAVARSEILTRDQASGTIVFKHRTFAEFLYAKWMVSTGPLAIDGRVEEMYWINTYFFALGLKKDAPEALTQILARGATSEGARWMRLINVPNYCLAAYTTPYDVIVRAVAQMATEAARIYLDGLEGKTLEAFGRLSRMQLLYLMQLLMRKSYSFAFFKRAIEDAAVAITADGPDAPWKAYAVFFLNVAYIDVGGTESFDFLLKGLQLQLPLDLAVAIKHEGERLGHKSDLMKKQDRRILKLVRADEGMKKVFDDMYERPLRRVEAAPKKRAALPPARPV